MKSAEILKWIVLYTLDFFGNSKYEATSNVKDRADLDVHEWNMWFYL